MITVSSSPQSLLLFGRIFHCRVVVNILCCDCIMLVNSWKRERNFHPLGWVKQSPFSWSADSQLSMEMRVFFCKTTVKQ